MKPKPYRTSPTSRHWSRLTKAFVWIFLVIFVATSVGAVFIMGR
ncbi:MAG: hypothetical protein JWN27_3942 [Candidatus Eremiobacteraeota bacterium]|jgi:hypothetical protein|nr:hypothetical protein [Candidatus Eremiobacteraeota bacterium]